MLYSSKTIPYFCYQVLCIGRDFNAVFGFLRPADRRMLNQIVHLVLVRIVKWRNSNYHFVDQDAERPPIERLVMS